MIDLSSKPIPSDSFCVRELGDETIFLSENGDTIHSLDSVGTFVWQQVLTGKTFAEILDEICDTYEVERDQAETDLQGFVQALLDKQLISL